jgi:hypothetical protein
MDVIMGASAAINAIPIVNHPARFETSTFFVFSPLASVVVVNLNIGL